MEQAGLEELLSRLGAVKHPVLLSSSTFSGGMLWFGKGLLEHPLADSALPAVTGSGMVAMSALIFLTGLAFYAYAFLHLPSSTQELLFLQEGRAAIQRHDKTVRNRRRTQGRQAVPKQEAAQ